VHRVLLAEHDEDDALGHRAPLHVKPRVPERDGGRAILGELVGAGADRRKGNALRAHLGRELERALIALRELDIFQPIADALRSIGVRVGAPDRADRVHDPRDSRFFQIESGGDLGLSGRAAPECPVVREQARSCCVVDGAVDAAATE